MATFTQIVTLRLEINDPYGVINILSVATKSVLPGTPAPQTAYKVTANGGYYRTLLEEDAELSDYELIQLQISDDKLSDIIDEYGEQKAIRIALQSIIKRIIAQFPIVRSQSGAESIQYQSLMDLYKVYKGLLDIAKEQELEDTGNSTGQWFQMKTPTIGGGNL